MASMSPSFGNLLNRLRREHDLTQLELSASAAISNRHLSFLETGRAKPSEPTAASSHAEWTMMFFALLIAGAALATAAAQAHRVTVAQDWNLSD